MKKYKEKTLEFSEDVDFIYNKSNLNLFVNWFNESKKNNKIIIPTNILKSFKNSSNVSLVLYKGNTKNLPSSLSKKANKINSCSILVGIFPFNSNYDPIKKQIWISCFYRSFKLLYNEKITLFNELKYLLSPSDFKIFCNEFSSSTLKARISHEISHWLNDSLYNLHITNQFNLIPKNSKYNGLTKSYLDSEIDGYIHGIKEIKKQVPKWEKIGWNDLFIMYSSLIEMIRKINKIEGKEEVENFLKKLIKRMHRENLLNSKLKSFPIYKKFL